MASKQQLIDDFVEDVFQKLGVSREALHPLLKFVGIEEYPRKSCLLHAGDTWNKLLYIHRGLIRLYYIDLEGREFNKAFFFENQCIWPVAPRDRNEGVLFNIAAVEKTLVIECPFKQLYDFLNERGKWEQFALPFAETLVEQKFRREHDLLLLSTTERFEMFLRENPQLARRIPDYHMASFLGVSNVTISRIKSKSFNK